MNQKRKAELQRKLSMTSVPRPPAGLLERIKADIPEELPRIDRHRGGFARSRSFMMRVAASLIVLADAAKPAAPPATATVAAAPHRNAVDRAAVEPAKKQKEEHEQPRDEQTAS